jgi:hypothetical protein
MNNFLRGFGNFKKNENGITEYVDYLGTKYTYDPTTKKWKSNGRVLSEAALSDMVLSEQEGVGDAADDSGGGTRRSAQIQDTFDLQFAFEPNGSALISPFTDFIIYDGGASGGYSPPFYDYRNGNNRFMLDYLFFIRKTTDSNYHKQRFTNAAGDGFMHYLFPASSDYLASINGITYIQNNSGSGNEIREEILNEWLQGQAQDAFGYNLTSGSTLPILFDFETWFDNAIHYGNSGDLQPYSLAQTQDTILDINPSYAGSTLVRIVQGPLNEYGIAELNEGITYLKQQYGDDLKLSIWSYPRVAWILKSATSAGLTFSPAEGWTSDANYLPYTSTQGITHFSYYFKLSDFATSTIPVNKQAAELARMQQEAQDHTFYQFQKAFQYTDYISVFNYQVVPTTESFSYYNTDGYNLDVIDEYDFLTDKLYRSMEDASFRVSKTIAGSTYAKPTLQDIDQDIIPTRSMWYHDTILRTTDPKTVLTDFPLFVPKNEQLYNTYRIRQQGANAVQWWGVSNYFWTAHPNNIRRDILFNVFGLTYNTNQPEYWFPTIAGLCGIPDLATSTWSGSTARNFFGGLWNEYTYDILEESKTILSDIFPVREAGAVTPTDIYFELAGKTLAAETTFLGVTCHVRFVDQNNYTPIIDYAFNPGSITVGSSSQIGSIPVDSSVAYRIDSWVEGIPNHTNPVIEAIHRLTFNVVNASANDSVIGTFQLSLDYEDHG